MTKETPENKKNEKMPHIGLRLKQLREEQEITQEEMAGILGCTQGAITFIERRGAFGLYTLKYLEFMDSRGYNLSWVLIPKNDNIVRQKVFQNLDFVRKELVEKIEKLRRDNLEQRKQLDIVYSILTG